MDRAAPARRRRRLLVGASLASALGACVDLLGIPAQTELAADAFCKCEGYAELFVKADGSDFADCAEHVGRALESDPERASEWLELFESADCRQCSEDGYPCSAAAPVCIPKGAPCAVDATCCGYDPGGLRTYCGFAGAEGTETACVEDPPECLPPGGDCDEDADCCGGAGFLALCAGKCLRACDPADPRTCPTCCGEVVVPEGSVGICNLSDVFDDAPACSMLCDDGECPEGSFCSAFDLPSIVDAKVYRCVQFQP